MRNAYVRAALVVFAGLILTGCRATTDRMRVLEAEKADSERRNQDLKHQQAELRAELIKAEGRAESGDARTRALEAQLEMLRERESATTTDPVTMIDMGALKGLEGEGISVTERDDGGATVVMSSDITFRAGRADLSNKAQGVLQRVAKSLRDVRGVSHVRVEGHTDSDPIRKSGWKNNRELSLARAKKVRMFLASKGIEETKLSVEGFGSTKPIASNTTRAGKAANRRVEIVLVANR